MLKPWSLIPSQIPFPVMDNSPGMKRRTTLGVTFEGHHKAWLPAIDVESGVWKVDPKDEDGKIGIRKVDLAMRLLIGERGGLEGSEWHNEVAPLS